MAFDFQILAELKERKGLCHFLQINGNSRHF